MQQRAMHPPPPSVPYQICIKYNSSTSIMLQHHAAAVAAACCSIKENMHHN
jgi:hypothetical protein